MYYVEISSIGSDLFLTITKGKEILAEESFKTINDKDNILHRWAFYHKCGYSTFKEAFSDYQYYITGEIKEENIFDEAFEREKVKDFNF